MIQNHESRESKRVTREVVFHRLIVSSVVGFDKKLINLYFSPDNMQPRHGESNVRTIAESTVTWI